MARKQTCAQIRKLVIKDIQKGSSQRKVAAKFEVSKTQVQKLWKKFRETGCVADRAGRGRNRATTDRDDSRIVREIKKNPCLTARSIRENLQLNVSNKTIERRLREANFHSRLARKRPFINKRNKIKRLKFAKMYVDMPIDFWKKVVWSDESKFELFNRKTRLRVWRKSGEEYQERHLQQTVKYGGGSIMIWGCFAWSGVGNLVKIDGTLTADKYIDILSENLEISSLRIGLEDDFVFQQDNDPKHTAIKTQTFFKSNRIKCLDWPPQSPDLNPIENLWSILDEKIDKTGVTNKENYFAALKRTWEELDEKYLQNLVESIPRRLQTVIEAKGSHTKY